MGGAGRSKWFDFSLDALSFFNFLAYLFFHDANSQSNHYYPLGVGLRKSLIPCPLPWCPRIVKSSTLPYHTIGQSYTYVVGVGWLSYYYYVGRI